MAGVSVSRNALESVRATLNQFKIEVADVPFSISGDVSALQAEGDDALRRLQTEIGNLKQQVFQKKGDITRLQDQYARAWRELKETEAALKQAEQSLAGIENELARCESELSHLRAEAQNAAAQSAAAQNAAAQNADDSGAAAASAAAQSAEASIRMEINTLEKHLAELKGYAREAAQECRSYRAAIRDLKCDLSRLDSDIKQAQAELLDLERTLSRKRDKLQRLRYAYDELRAASDQLAFSARSFADRALTQTAQDLAGVDQCIRYIEEYLLTNL